MIKAWALRNAPAIVIVLALVGSAVAVGNWLIRVGRGQVQPQLDKALAERDNLAATLEFERANAKRAEDAVNGYTKEIAGLRRALRESEIRRRARREEPAALQQSSLLVGGGHAFLLVSVLAGLAVEVGVIRDEGEEPQPL